jgi:hypothetical protein
MPPAFDPPKRPIDDVEEVSNCVAAYCTTTTKLYQAIR